mgnify:CR=1 FL=1
MAKKKEKFSIGRWVRKKREQKKWTPAFLAEVLGIDLRFLLMIEEDAVPTSIDLCNSLHTLFGVRNKNIGPLTIPTITAINELQIADFFGGVMNNGTRDVFDSLVPEGKVEVVNLLLDAWSHGEFKPRFVKRNKQ